MSKDQSVISQQWCGDEAAASDMHAFYDDNNSWLVGWLRKKMGSNYDAEDLAQDTFMRIIAGRDLSVVREPRAYLVTIARSLVVNHYRRKDIERACLEALANLPQPEALSPEREALMIETLYQINILLDGLPAKVKKAFLLSQLDGLTYREIAGQLGVSVSSIKKYMYKATHHCLLFKIKSVD